MDLRNLWRSHFKLCMNNDKHIPTQSMKRRKDVLCDGYLNICRYITNINEVSLKKTPKMKISNRLLILADQTWQRLQQLPSIQLSLS